MQRAILSGNEAFARGAYEAGVRVASAYPGTPSTEILENIANYPEIDSSWAPNEKVSLEVAIGAGFGGARSRVAMKQVGVNAAADPLLTMSCIGPSPSFRMDLDQSLCLAVLNKMVPEKYLNENLEAFRLGRDS